VVKRSARSIPTGPGSRGGEPLTPSYWRDWRRAHPEYREREAERSRQIRVRMTDLRDSAVPSFTEALVDMVRDEVARLGQREVARRLLIDHSSVSRLLTTDRVPGADAVDAMVAYFGIYRVVEGVQARVRLARERALARPAIRTDG
jgi:hypothetical protein